MAKGSEISKFRSLFAAIGVRQAMRCAGSGCYALRMTEEPRRRPEEAKLDTLNALDPDLDRAIACGNPREAEVLLRFKVLVGDSEAEVVEECFTGLLTVAPQEWMRLVAG